ncbi:MAG: EAL domain-containing protein [Desulfuromusa sp.]|nr:EAL domain-containing protein [Desulfuromusa sp.]
MIFKSPAMRLSIALVLLSVNLLFVANLIGFIPDRSESALELRKGLSESLALQFSAVAETGEFQTIQDTLRAVVERNDDIRSAAIRTSDGRLLALAGEHLANWKTPAEGKSTPTHIHVPIFRKDKKWATVEMRFAPLWTGYLSGGWTQSFVSFLAFIALSSLISYFFIIKRTLRELDPAAVIPERVQKAFDVLKEGVLVLDEKEQIVMANKSFASLFEKSPTELIGLKGSELGWQDCHNSKQVRQLPWIKVLHDGLEQQANSLTLLNSFGHKIKLAVNAAMVPDNAGKCRGSLVTFDDITQVEEKNFELSNLVDQLQLTQEEIEAKSQELEFLANRDPLTLCLNRRSMDRNFAALFTKAKTEGKKLSCLMADIDFFKSVNDRYGHATGDQVIKAIADILKTCTRDSDLVARYGGEEFCVILPDLDLEQAAQIAERIRHTIAKKPCGGVKITASLGVSSIEHHANKPDEMVNQADKALYAAKNSGRNRVIQWGKENLDTLAQSDDAASESDQSGTAESAGDQVQLQQRVQELEGLLAKQTLEFEHFEMYDLKTGLPTRSLFEDRIGHEIARGMRKDSLVVVLAINIDTIRRVYETLGASVADLLMAACGHRLNDVLREDIDTVAVIEDFKGSSSVSLVNQTEFGVLLTDITQLDDITWVVKRLIDSFRKPYAIKGNEIYTSAFIGVSIYPHDGKSAEDLYSSATNACSYAQKNKGEDGYLFASADLNEKATQQMQIENELHGAIQNDELELHYQPQIESATGRIAGFEALLRWQSAQLGSIPPGDFIPVAEKSGLIDRLGDWVLYRTCQQLRSWLDMGLDVGSVAVNLSGGQLRQPNLAYRIQSILDEFKLDAHMLEIELTESSLVTSHDKSFAILKQIKAMGLRITMDDFGTGYSSLSYLKNIPVSCLKIDHSFTAGIGRDETSEKLIASIVSMARGLGLEVVAEGVEKKSQADHLIALGCEYLQGYYFSRPVSHNKVTEILQKQLEI